MPFERLTGTAIQKIGTGCCRGGLGVKPGDVITYYARATDVGRGKRSTEATSDIFFLEVKPFNEEFVVGARARQVERVRSGNREPDSGAEGDHLVDLERRATFAGGAIDGGRQGDRRGSGRIESSRRTAADVANDSRSREIASTGEGSADRTAAPRFRRRPGRYGRRCDGESR